MASSTDFIEGRCITWCTEPPNKSRSRKSPVFLFHDKECYLYLFRQYKEFYSPNIYTAYVYYVYLKHEESPIPTKISPFTVRTYVGLESASCAFSATANTISDPEKCSIWYMTEDDLLSKVKFDIQQDITLKFVFVFDSLAAPFSRTGIDSKSVQASILMNPASVQTSNISSTKSCLEHLSDDFCKLFVEDAHYDVLLKCGQRTVQAHKTVLRARSSVFATMLTCDMVEGLTSCVELQDMDEVMFQEFVHYLYSGTMPELSWDSAKKLYAVGDKYAVIGLKKRCAIFLADSLTTENACECLALADAHHDSDLKQRIIPYILDHGIPFLDDHWLPFVREHPALSSEVLRSFYLSQKQV